MLLPILLAFANPCQPCHPQIVQSYEKTAMARSSSKYVTNLKSSEPFLDAVTQTTFSITPGFLLKFSKPNQFDGYRQLSFAIGSGRVGHSFLFKQGNRLFQAPVSYYSETRQYQLSPGFQRRPQLDLTRVVEPSCLNCHTTAFNPVTLDITPGIGCERCHGNTNPDSSLPDCPINSSSFCTTLCAAVSSPPAVLVHALMAPPKRVLSLRSKPSRAIRINLTSLIGSTAHSFTAIRLVNAVAMPTVERRR